MLQRYLILWLSLSSLLAAIWPVAEFDPFLPPPQLLGIVVAVIMLCVGSILPGDEVQQVFRAWPTVLWGTCVQYATMPFLAWAMASLLQLDEDMRIGVILAGCVPGAMASNVLTMTAKGNVSYSVGLTTSATLISPLVVPAAMKLTLGTSIAAAKLSGAAIALSWQVVLPVILGFMLSRYWWGWKKFSERYASTLANLTILWVIAAVVGLNRDKLAQVNGIVIVALLGLNVLGYLAGYAGAKIARLSIPMQRALILEVGMQNAGVGASIALALFSNQKAIALPCAAYAFGCMLTGTMLAQWMGRTPSVADPVA